jgi:hypothetical protein
MPRLMFWARAIGVPSCLGLCAYVLYASRFAPHTIFFYLFFLFLLLVDIVSLVPDRARDVFVVLGALVFGLWIIEGAAFAFVSDTPVSTKTKGTIVRNPVFGWGPGNPGVYHERRIYPYSGATIFNVTYTFDENRLRKTVSSDHGPTIAFFGDSFTLGVGVNDPETMPQAFADLTDHKIRVLNLGFWAYSPQQFLRAMETGVFDKIVPPDLRLFVFFTAPWQSDRVACKADYVSGAPRYVLENGSPIYTGVCFDHGRPKIERLLSHVAIFRALFKRYFRIGTRGDIQLYIAETLKAAALTRERYHVPTIVLFTSAGHDNLWMSGFTDQDIMNALRAGGLPVIDVSLGKHTYNNPKLSIPGDWHPTPFAHRARATLLKQFLVARMPEILALPRQ